ncbi:co-chaperone GroES [Candidatus Pacearchaeota archaeon]|nr:co-chaperone GroES [Candidatus Pacearchaeota archaeon]
MNIKPLGERVLLRHIKQTEERTKSGLILPKSKDEKKEGIVVAVGTMNNGSTFPVKEGDRVIYGGYSSEEIEINSEKHLIIELKDIAAKIE